jgi:hypothetical protein
MQLPSTEKADEHNGSDGKSLTVVQQMNGLRRNEVEERTKAGATIHNDIKYQKTN